MNDSKLSGIAKFLTLIFSFSCLSNIEPASAAMMISDLRPLTTDQSEQLIKQNQDRNICLERANAARTNRSALEKVCIEDKCANLDACKALNPIVLPPIETKATVQGRELTINIQHKGSSGGGSSVDSQHWTEQGDSADPSKLKVMEIGESGSGVFTTDGSTKPATQKNPLKAASADKTAIGSKANQSNFFSPQSVRASGQSEQDKMTCERAARGADLCCRNPAACGATNVQSASQEDDTLDLLIAAEESALQEASDQASMTKACSKTRQQSGQAGSGNSKAADVCLSRYTTCVTICSGLAAYQYDNAAAGEWLNAEAQRCSGYSSRVSELLNQSDNLLRSARSGLECEKGAQTAGYRPNSANGQQQNQSRSDVSGACIDNPQAPGCEPAAAAAGTDTQVERKIASDFYLPDNRDFHQPVPTYSRPDSSTNTNSQVKYQAVPNNTGGSVPGLDWNHRPNTNSVAPRPTANTSYDLKNLDQGFRSGGYSQPAQIRQRERQQMQPQKKPSGGNSPYPVGLDLKQYLPGGRHDPYGRIGGNRLNKDIHGSVINIWWRISERMREKCSSGRLEGCDRLNTQP